MRWTFVIAVLPVMAFGGTPYESGNATKGRELHQQNNCSACHARRLGGDGSEMYLRTARKVTTPQKLLAQISYCATELKVNWFPEDEQDVATYLDKSFYKFK